MPTVDAYSILGVPASASEAELRTAWRRGVMRWHPDRNPGNPRAAAMFLDIQEAWRLIGSASGRAAYDAQRRSTAGQGDGQGARPRPPPPEPGPESVAQADAGPRGDDVVVELRVRLASLFEAQTRKITYRVAVTCTYCRGRVPFCRACGGSGQEFVERQVLVGIPPGCHDGQLLRIRGYGHDGPYFAARGDLLMKILWSKAGRWTWNSATGRIETRLRSNETLHAKGGQARLLAPNGKWVRLDLAPAPRGSLVRVNGMGLPSGSGSGRDAAWIEWL